MNEAVVTIKFSESEVDILISSLENTIDTESAFTAIPQNYNTLLKDLKDIKKMIKSEKHEAVIDKKLDDIPSEEGRNGKQFCDECDD